MDLQDKISLGAAMFATPAIDRGATTMLAEVVSDATDGEVCVNLPDEEGTVQQVTVPCNGDIREGDMATLIVEDGRITAISASGEGERSKAETEAAQGAADAAQSTADTAQADATQAKTDAASASTAAASAQALAEEANVVATATGQHFFTDDNGVHVTTDEGEAAGTHNLLANSKGVFIREGENPLAGMTSDKFSIYDKESGSAVAYFSANRSGLNSGLFETRVLDYVKSSSGELYGKSAMVGTVYDWGADYAGKYLGLTLMSQYGYTKEDGTAGRIWHPLASSNISADDDGTLRIITGFGHGGYGSTPSTTMILGDEVTVNGTDIMLLAYPVGSIYMSVNSTSPAELFGGTWEEIAGGRVLMGQNSTYAAGSTGGATTHTHTGPAHTHAYGFAYVCHYGAMLAYNTDGSYRILNNGTWEDTPTRSSSASVGNNTPVMAATGRTTAYASRVAARANTSSSGTDKTGSASSLMPYLSVYMWKRTA